MHVSGRGGPVASRRSVAQSSLARDPCILSGPSRFRNGPVTAGGADCAQQPRLLHWAACWQMPGVARLLPAAPISPLLGGDSWRSASLGVFLAGIHPLCQTHFLGGINLVFDSPSRASQSVCAPAQLFTRLQGCAEFCTAAPHTFLCLACCGVANRSIRIKSDAGEHDDAGTVTAAAAFLLMEGRKAKKAVRRGFAADSHCGGRCSLSE